MDELIGAATDEVVCAETLVADLRNPEVLNGDVLRYIYITGKPMGSEGKTGVMQQGDLSGDLTAKVIYFDRRVNAYAVQRNGNPPQPEEHVPDADIGALLRSFVREASVRGQVYITITDTIPGKGIETIRKVIPARQLELYCEHGPDPATARGIPYVRTPEDRESAVSWNTVIIVVVVLALTWYIYRRYVHKPRPPSSLPDMRPYMLEQRHGARKLQLNQYDTDDVRASLGRIRH
jgi:hypothetical protein